jgi:tRNA-specific 2-thiouridylase
MSGSEANSCREAHEHSAGSAASRVVVAMSGGVDSSVAAYLLAQQGLPIIGVAMQVWDYKKTSSENSRATCCSPADFCDARMVASKLSIPFYVVDFEKTFEREVIQKFVDTYEQGLTPNPCIDCNNRVKFRELRERALGFGCSHVATGHYARIKQSDAGYHLLRGRDLEKDQSYFLYTCRQDELERTLFPVGEYTKPEIREIARAAGLPTANKAESQDICFISGSAGDFVASIGGRRRPPGEIVRTTGEKVGEHDGIHRYTVGQRRGLNIGGTSDPLYVVEIDPDANKVIVGERDQLKREDFSVGEMHWVNPELIKRVESGERDFDIDVVAQVRSRHRGVPAVLRVTDKDSAKILFKDEWVPVSPGQAAVLYDTANEEVLGGGRITRGR